jgi:hypothetical protein
MGPIFYFTMPVTSKDNGYNAILKRAIGLKPVTIRVGILEADGAAPHEGTDRSLIEIAAWNHFGVLSKNGGWKIPPRSWLTSWFDSHEAELRAKLTELMQSVIAGKRTREQALNAMGAWAVGQVQQEIADGVPPPNAPATIKAKGSSTPLIDHGQLRASQSFDIVEGK